MAVSLAGCASGGGNNSGGGDTGGSNNSGGGGDTGGSNNSGGGGGTGGSNNSGGGGDTGGSNYPNKRVEYIVPFSEGGGTDTYARKIIPEVSNELSVPIQINNVPGSASLRGAGQMVKSDPDGYTFGGFNPPSTPVSYLLNPPDNWDLRDLRGVCGYARTPYVMYANPDVSFSDFGGLIDAYNNGDISNMGGQQRGGIVNVIAEILKNNEKYNVGWKSYVGYDGGGPLVQAIASGEVKAGITTDASGLSAAKDDRVKVLAILSSQGSSVFPDAPNVVDLGYPNIDYVGQLTRCMWMPGKTPDARVKTMANAVKKSLQSDSVQQWAKDTGNIIEYNPPEFADQVLQKSFKQIPKNVDLDKMRQQT